MVGPERKKALAGRGLPFIEHWPVKRNVGPVAVRAHGNIFYSNIRQVVGKAPCYTVHVILHGCRDRYAQLVEPGHRLQECLVVVLSGELRHIEEHGRHLYLSVPYKMKEFLHLFLWPYPEPFPYGP